MSIPTFVHLQLEGDNCKESGTHTTSKAIPTIMLQRLHGSEQRMTHVCVHELVEERLRKLHIPRGGGKALDAIQGAYLAHLSLADRSSILRVHGPTIAAILLGKRYSKLANADASEGSAVDDTGSSEDEPENEPEDPEDETPAAAEAESKGGKDTEHPFLRFQPTGQTEFVQELKGFSDEEILLRFSRLVLWLDDADCIPSHFQAMVETLRKPHDNANRQLCLTIRDESLKTLRQHMLARHHHKTMWDSLQQDIRGINGFFPTSFTEKDCIAALDAVLSQTNAEMNAAVGASVAAVLKDPLAYPERFVAWATVVDGFMYSISVDFAIKTTDANLVEVEILPKQFFPVGHYELQQWGADHECHYGCEPCVRASRHALKRYFHELNMRSFNNGRLKSGGFRVTRTSDSSLEDFSDRLNNGSLESGGFRVTRTTGSPAGADCPMTALEKLARGQDRGDGRRKGGAGGEKWQCQKPQSGPSEKWQRQKPQSGPSPRNGSVRSRSLDYPAVLVVR
jgi:hypothetical protein